MKSILALILAAAFSVTTIGLMGCQTEGDVTGAESSSQAIVK